MSTNVASEVLYTYGEYLVKTAAEYDAYGIIRYAPDSRQAVELHVSEGPVLDLSDELGSIAAVVHIGVSQTIGLDLTTGSGDDHVHGGGGNDTVRAGEGDDTIYGGGGLDRLYGGGGNDILHAASAAYNSYLEGGSGNDTYILNSLNGRKIVEVADGGIDQLNLAGDLTQNELPEFVENVLLTGTFAATVYGNETSNRIIGNGADNVLSGEGGDDTIYGGGGNDTIYATSGNDHLAGGAGNDRYELWGGSAAITEAAGGGIDTVWTSVTATLDANIENLEMQWGSYAALEAVGNGLANVILGNFGNNNLYGGDGNDQLDGEDGSDHLYGGAGNDRLDGDYTLGGTDFLYGGDGNDTLTGTYMDRLEGGSGDDIYVVYDQYAGAMIEASGGGVDQVNAWMDFTLSAEFENLALDGGASRATGNTVANRIWGNWGDNTLFGLGGNDTLYGGDGRDRLDGGSGTDRLEGGAGDDLYIITALDDVIVEGAGGFSEDGVVASCNYVLGANLENLSLVGMSALSGTGNGGTNFIAGNTAANALYGGGGNDVLWGGDGDDRIDGGAGNDSMEGGRGDDTFIVNSSGDDTYEQQSTGGRDLVAASVSHTLQNNLENLMLKGAANLSGTGNELANQLTGNSAANILNGLGGSDTLLGGSGNDVLRGGGGKDRLTGGTGSDDFVFRATSDSAPGSTTRDVITSFSRGYDDIVVSSIDAKVGVDGNQAFVLDTNGSFSIGEIRQKWTDFGLLVEFNRDNDSSAEMAVLIQGMSSKLASTDFVL